MKRLYRDREQGIFLGVCAGIAEFSELPPIGVRVLAVLALLISFWPTVLAYIVAGLLLKDRPLTYRGGHDETDFWRTAR